MEQIINSGYKAYMVVTGGGTRCLPMLLECGGASSFLLEFITPYSTKAINKFLYNGTIPISQLQSLSMLLVFPFTLIPHSLDTILLLKIKV